MAKLLVVTLLTVALAASAFGAPYSFDDENQPADISIEPEEEPSDLDLLEDRDDEPSELDDLDEDEDSDNDELGEEDMRDDSAPFDEAVEGAAAEPSDMEDDVKDDLTDFGF